MRVCVSVCVCVNVCDFSKYFTVCPFNIYLYMLKAHQFPICCSVYGEINGEKETKKQNSIQNSAIQKRTTSMVRTKEKKKKIYPIKILNLVKFLLCTFSITHFWCIKQQFALLILQFD